MEKILFHFLFSQSPFFHEIHILTGNLAKLHYELDAIIEADQIVIGIKYDLRANFEHRTNFIEAVLSYSFMDLFAFCILGLEIKAINSISFF